MAMKVLSRERRIVCRGVAIEDSFFSSLHPDAQYLKVFEKEYWVRKLLHLGLMCEDAKTAQPETVGLWVSEVQGVPRFA